MPATTPDVNDLAIFLPRDYTPGGAPLSDSNICASIQAAYQAAATQALTEAGGAIIQIPMKPSGGSWKMGSSGLDLYGADSLANVWIQGPATLAWPVGFAGECIRLRGSSPASFRWGTGGLRDLTIICENDDPSNTCKGVVLDACVLTTFENVHIQAMQSGIGFFCRDFQSGNNNSQECSFINCTAVGMDTGFDLSNCTNARFFNCSTQASHTCDFKLDAVMASFYGGSSQSTVAKNFDFSGDGGSRILIEDWYSESLDPSGTLFYCPAPAIAHNVITVNRYVISSAISKAFDIGANVALSCHDIETSNVTTVLKARNASQITFNNVDSPLLNPSGFDLDATSTAHAVFTMTGTGVFGSHVDAASLGTASFAEGSEPSSPVAGWSIFSSTNSRPRAYTGSAWKNIAYTDDPTSLTEVLRPYASDIWDLAIASKRTTVGTTVDHVTGLVHGSVLQENSSGSSRPTFTASDPFFLNRPSVTFAPGSSTYLTTTLANPIQIGEYAAFFVVLRMGNATVIGGRRVALLLNGTGGVFLGANDGNVGAQVWYATDFCQAASGASDIFGHAVYSEYQASNGHTRILTDGVAGAVAGTGPGTPAASNLSSFQVGAYSSSEVSDFSIAYVALLHGALSTTDLTRANAFAKATYGIP